MLRQSASAAAAGFRATPTRSVHEPMKTSSSSPSSSASFSSASTASSNSAASTSSSLSTIRKNAPCRELLERAQVLSHEHKYELALEQLNMALQLSPELYHNVRFFLNRGSYHFKSNKPEAALEDFNRAMQLDPNVASVHFNKGNVLKVMGNRPEEALKCFQRACELDPRLVDAHVQSSLMFLQLKKYQFALAAAQRALQLDAKHMSALVAKLRALVFLSRFDEAVDTINLMIQFYQRSFARTNPNVMLATVETMVPLPQRKMFARILIMASSRCSSGDLQRSVGLARHATELFPTYDTFFELGSALMRASKYSDAALMFRKASEFDSYARVDGLIMEGAALISARQPEKALVALKRAGRIEEGRREVRYYLGLAYFNLGRYLEAIPSLDRVVNDNTVVPEEDQVKAKARFLLSSCYIHAGEEYKAYELLCVARKTPGVGADVLFQAGYVASLVGKDDEAKECYEMVLRIDPKDSRGICGLANLKEKHSKLPSAPPAAAPPSGPPPKSNMVTKMLLRKKESAIPPPPLPSRDKPPVSGAGKSMLSFATFKRSSKPTNLLEDKLPTSPPPPPVKPIVTTMRWDCDDCGCNNGAEMQTCFGCDRARQVTTEEQPKSKFTLFSKAAGTVISPKSSTRKAVPPQRPLSATKPPPSTTTFALKPKVAPPAAASGLTRKPPPIPSSKPVLLANIPPPSPAAKAVPMRFPKRPPPPSSMPPIPESRPTATPPRRVVEQDLLPSHISIPPPPPPSPPQQRTVPAVPPPPQQCAVPAVPPPPQLPARKQSLIPPIDNLPSPSHAAPKPPNSNNKPKPKLATEVIDMIHSLFPENEEEIRAMFLDEGLETLFDIELLELEDFEKICGMKRAWARRVIKYLQDVRNSNCNNNRVLQQNPPPIPASRPASSAALFADLGQFQRSNLHNASDVATPLRAPSTRPAPVNQDMLTRIKSFERTSLRAADLRPTPPPILNQSEIGNNAFFGMILDAMNSRRGLIEDKHHHQDSDEEDMFEADW